GYPARHRLDLHTHLAQQRTDDALFLGEQRREHVLGCQLLVVSLLRQLVCSLQGLLGLRRHLVESHFSDAPVADVSTASGQTRFGTGSRRASEQSPAASFFVASPVQSLRGAT